MSAYPHVDRNPCIPTAGKLTHEPCEVTAKELFQDVKLQDKIDAIRRQFGFIDTKDYSSGWVKPVDSYPYEVFTELQKSMQKPLPTSFQVLDDELKNTIYHSYWNKAVGKCRDPTPGLPFGMKPLEVTFGKPTVQSEPAGLVVNPPKKIEQVEAEYEQCHNLYTFSHNDYYGGEQVHRGYSPPFNKHNSFGIPSKKDESGARAKRCLTWFNNDPLSNVSRRQAAVRNRTLPPLGKGLDKTGVTDLFPVDHTYGKILNMDFYGVEDLLNECPPSLARRDMLTFLAYANRMRQLFSKKVNLGEIVLEELYDEIMSLNDDNKGGYTSWSVDFECIDRILKRHKIYLNKDKLKPLLVIFGLINENGQIRVRDFISFIDKNLPFPKLKKEHYIMPPEFQSYKGKCGSECQNPKDDYRIQRMPPAGLPTIQVDKPYPEYHLAIVDIDNLGQETIARMLISPSIFTQYGLTHRDFFKPRTKEFLGNLFKKIDVSLPEEELDQIYKEGYELDQTGGVCVETFRNLLDERAYKSYNRF